MKMMKDLYIKYKNFILYIFFGICTTMINIITYYICAYIFLVETIISTTIAWIFAVFFAYVTNRKWVFDSKAIFMNEIIKEVVSFFSCRLATGVIDILIMYLFVNLLHFNDIFIKIIANIIVIIFNYIASKFLIFK